MAALRSVGTSSSRWDRQGRVAHTPYSSDIQMPRARLVEVDKNKNRRMTSNSDDDLHRQDAPFISRKQCMASEIMTALRLHKESAIDLRNNHHLKLTGPSSLFPTSRIRRHPTCAAPASTPFRRLLSSDGATAVPATSPTLLFSRPFLVPRLLTITDIAHSSC